MATGGRTSHKYRGILMSLFLISLTRINLTLWIPGQRTRQERNWRLWSKASMHWKLDCQIINGSERKFRPVALDLVLMLNQHGVMNGWQSKKLWNSPSYLVQALSPWTSFQKLKAKVRCGSFWVFNPRIGESGIWHTWATTCLVEQPLPFTIPLVPKLLAL